jgi:FkbM family methyltransferase
MSAKTGKLNVIAFGVGHIFSTLKHVLYNTFNVIAFADNDVEKQGTLIDGIEIINPINITSRQFDKVVVMTPTFQKDVVRQLIDYGINSDDIILGVNFLMNNKHGALYEYYVDESMDISFRYSAPKCVNVLIENSDFKWIIKSKDAVILPSLIMSGGFSEEEISAFFSLSNEFYGETRGVFLDVGANVGTTSLCAIKNYRVSEVIAIEPSSDNFALLQCNVFINKLHSKIHAVNAAVSDNDGFANLLISPDSPSDNRVRNDIAPAENVVTERIGTVTLDSLIKGRNASEIAFLWVDVQGYEYFVLNGAKNLLSKNKKLAVQIEFWPLGLRETDSLDLLCLFCKEHFTKYIDIKEYLSGRKEVHEIKSIDRLPLIYKDYTYTDLFLIP